MDNRDNLSPFQVYDITYERVILLERILDDYHVIGRNCKQNF
jgi:hypothetical protein